MTNNNQCTQGQGVDVNRNRKIQKKKKDTTTHLVHSMLLLFGFQLNTRS
jgi:hypothetical protein